MLPVLNSVVSCVVKAVSDGIHFALQDMSNAIKRSVMSTYLNVPEPLIASDSVATVMYPWRAFISKYVRITFHSAAWSVVKTSVSGWRTFPDLCLIYGLHVTTS